MRLLAIPGIGAITASLFAVELGDAKHSRSGRDFDASIGIVPLQYSTGGCMEDYQARLSSWSGEQSSSRLRIDLGNPQIIDLNRAKIGLTIDHNFASISVSRNIDLF